MIPTDLVLTYFDAGGRAEPIQMIFAYAGIEFKDIRIPGKEFPDKKSSLTLPFNQVPTLQANGEIYAQSIAIARYAAKIGGLYPENPLKALEADLQVDAIIETMTTFINAAFMEQDKDKKAKLLEDANEKTFPRLLNGLESRAVGPYLLGDTPSYADIYLLDFHKQIWTAFPDMVQLSPNDFPKLLASIEAIAAADPLKSYFTPKKRKLSSSSD